MRTVNKVRRIMAAGVLAMCLTHAGTALAQVWQSTPSLGAGYRVETAGAPDGVVTALWIDQLAVKASRYSGAGWNPPTVLHNQFGASDIAIVVDGAGTVTAAWTPGNGYLEAARFSGGAWTSTVQLTAPGQTAQQIDLVADASGVVTAVWLQGLDAIQASRFENGSWSQPVTVSGISTQNTLPQLAVDAAGAVTAIWFTYTGAFPTLTGRLRAARFVNGSWSSAIDVSTPNVDFGSAAVAAAPDGTVTAIWSAGSIQSSTFNGAGWSTPVQIGSGRGSSLSLEFGPVGEGTAIWIDLASQLFGARLANGVWTSAAISDVAAASQADLAVTPSGQATVLWTSGGLQGRLFSSRYVASDWSPPLMVVDAGRPVSGPRLTTSPSEILTATWVGQGPNPSIEASRFDPNSVPPPATVPTLTESAMLFFALALALIASVSLSRRNRRAPL
ncbi:MAG: hypothetical protein ACT6RD_04405 [Brevundimonas sp.]|uniref:hypothetical protein n=1 Tax=Brevundimonas sp. TaxID=1871086 RepID=UPI004033EA7A